METTRTQSTTKQLKPVLGFWDLMGASVGQIIGAGIMTLLGAAIAMTGRSVPLAFLIAAVISVLSFLPLIYISGTVRLRGGQYTMVAMLAGTRFAGAYVIIYIFRSLSLSMYALSFASYFISMFGIGTEQSVAFIILTLFFILNVLGIDKFAKVQNIIVILLIIALGAFAVCGIPQIQPDYFSEESWMTGGVMGLLQAGGLLTFAISGASTAINLSAEAKNPTRDIPMVMIVSTLLVAVIYGVIAVVAAGVLPVHEVAGQNLSMVAEAIMAKPVYVFFIVCGAGFALISTLNSQFAWAPKPVMQACDDGWLPAGMAKLSRWKTPVIILAILYFIGVICIFTGMSISVLGNISLIANGVTSLMINAYVWKIPKICPELWADSRFKTSPAILKLVAVLGSAAALLSIYLNATTLSTGLILFNIIVIAGSFLFAIIREKHAHMEISYEKA